MLFRSDVLEIAPLAAQLVEQVRTSMTPRALILHTCRFGPHSKGDDTRPAQVIAQQRADRDPLRIQAGRLDAGQRQAIEQAEDQLIKEAFETALAEPLPTREANQL